MDQFSIVKRPFSGSIFGYQNQVIDTAISNAELLISISNNTAKDIVENFSGALPEIKVLYPDIQQLINRFTQYSPPL